MTNASDDNSLTEAAIILAGGRGTRMKSDLPKVLHEILNKPLLSWIVEAADAAQITEKCVIVGGDLGQFEGFMDDNPGLSFCFQERARGTADAVSTASFAFPKNKLKCAQGKLVRGGNLTADRLLILAGDTPMLDPKVLRDFLNQSQSFKLGLIGVVHPNPFGYGRLILDSSGNLIEIVEEKSASSEQKKIDLVNSGVIVADRDFLFSCLEKVVPNEESGELYLTDVFKIASDEGESVKVYKTSDYRTFDGINDQEQLQRAAEWAQKVKVS